MTRINTNVSSLNAQKSLARTNSQMQQALTRLSTGLRINVGKDDPAGLIASEMLGSDIISTQKAIGNSQLANQMIATADSALGQVSSLLNDIRGLIEAAANSGALSADQIAANQLQIDSSLAAINRVSQTTKFQGRGLVDGSLDFVSNSAAIPTIQDLKINQATIGASGQLGVNVEITQAATQANIQSASGQAAAVATLKFSPRTLVTFTGAGTLDIVSMTAGPQMEGVKVTATDTGTEGATYDPTTKVLALTYDSAAPTTTDSLATLVNALAGTPFWAVGDGGNVTGDITSGDSLKAAELKFTAQTAGTDYNGFKVKMQQGAATGAQWNASAKELTITLDNTANTDLDALTTALQATSVANTFTITNTPGGGAATAAGTAIYGLDEPDLETKPVTNSGITGYLHSGFSAATQAVATLSFAPAVAAALETSGAGSTIDIKSKSVDAGAGVLVSFVDDNSVLKGNEYAVYDSTAKTLDVHYKGGTSTVADVVTAINKLDGWTATNTNAATDTDTVDATGQSTAKTVVDQLQIAALNPGADYNDLQIRLEAKPGLTAPKATYDSVKRELVIQVVTDDAVNADKTDLADIKTAIDALPEFSALAVQPEGGLGHMYALQSDANAVANTGSTGGNTLLADMVLEVAGATGSEAFNFGAGTSVNQIANAISLVSDSTGVTATQDNGLLTINSNGYGSKQFAAANVSGEGIAGTFKTSLSASRATGTDAAAKINGIGAVADGNLLSVITSTLDLSLQVSAGKVTAFNFVISGGGALFQLGPDVVANQQARMGIQSVNTTRLGGASGRLNQLASGQAASLANNTGLAAKIAEEAITSVTTLRGRLGAFQRTTLDTNIAALNDTVSALTDAQSSIRDADFATETANLQRAQILSQSGMAVLAIANSQPQNVLALLRNL